MTWRGGRRRFLGRVLESLAAGLPLVGAGLAARPAAALRVLPHEDYGAMVAAACGPGPEHVRLLAAFRAGLPPGLAPERAAALLKDLRCPTCGCPLAAAAGEEPLPGSGQE